MLEHGGLAERALRTQKRHLEGLLLSEAGRHDLAEQPRDLLVAQRPVVPVQRLAQDLSLALRPVKIDRLPGGRLRDADELRQARTVIDEGVDLRIDPVDALADAAEIHGAGGLRSHGRGGTLAGARFALELGHSIPHLGVFIRACARIRS